MDREFVAQLITILGVSLGGWMLFVQPKVRQFEEMHSVIRTATLQERQFAGDTVEDLADRFVESRTYINSIANRNKLAENTTLMYGMVSDLGAKNEVLVQSLTPESRIRTQPDTGCRTTRIDMVLEGRYTHIASFVQSVLELPGFLRPVALTVKPAGEADDGLATANFSCEIVQFDVPENLVDIGADP